MPQIIEPILPAKFDPSKAKYPYLATPKIKGVRFLIINRVAVLETSEPIKNKLIQKTLTETFPDGVDGSIVCNSDSKNTIAYLEHEDVVCEFECKIFDYIDSNKEEIDPYKDRSMSMICNLFTGFSKVFYEFIIPSPIPSEEYLNQYREMCLKRGHEGVLLKDPYATYKFGKSTIEDNIFLEF